MHCIPASCLFDEAVAVPDVVEVFFQCYWIAGTGPSASSHINSFVPADHDCGS